MSDPNNIAAGDVVMLKSGGAMTVEGIEAPPAHLKDRGKEMVRCVWFDANGSVQDRLFWPHLLVIDAKSSQAKEAQRVADEKRAAQLQADAKARSDEAAKRNAAAAKEVPAQSWQSQSAQDAEAAREKAAAADAPSAA